MTAFDETIEEDLGPKKSFWDHLRDLRTALLRSSIAIGIALIVCLFMAPQLIAILEWPLRRLDLFRNPLPTVSLQIGDTKLGPYEVTRENFPALPEGDAPQVVYRLGTTKIGETSVATVEMLPPVPAAVAGSLRVRLLNLSPAEAFFIAFRVAIYGAIIVAAPFWIYFMGQFFLPALNVRERSVFYQWLGWGVLLFFTGVLLTYFFLMPLALRASVEYSKLVGFEAHDWRANEYIGFVTKFIVGMGVGFQFPVVVLLLVKMGFVTHEQLGHYRRHVVIFSLVMGAILTTPEVITQVSMAIPLYVLFEISIAIAKYWDWKAKRAAAA